MALSGDKAANRTACQGPTDLTVSGVCKQGLRDPEPKPEKFLFTFLGRLRCRGDLGALASEEALQQLHHGPHEAALRL